MECTGETYGISRTAGVVVALTAIAVAALILLPLVMTVLPSGRDEVVGVLIASLSIPAIGLWKPLQEFTVGPDGLGFGNIFSRRPHLLRWADVTDVRLKRDALGVTNLEFRKKNARLYMKVPLSIIPNRQDLLRRLVERFPPDHPTRSRLEHAVRAYDARADNGELWKR